MTQEEMTNRIIKLQTESTERKLQQDLSNARRKIKEDLLNSQINIISTQVSVIVSAGFLGVKL